MPLPTAQETLEAKKATLAYLSLFRQKQSLPPGEVLQQDSQPSVALKK
jgi:hypothetical protein